MKDKLLKAGKIVNTHSLHGEIRIYPYCDSADFLCDFDTLYVNGKPMTIESARVHKGQALIKFVGIDSIDDAESLVGQIVEIDKSDVCLEDGRYFIEDIKGLTVKDIDSGVIYGKVTNVIETGANDVLEVSDGEKTLLVPKIDDVVKSVELENSLILIRPLKGLFE